MERKINVGLIGYGLIGKPHSRGYRDLPMFFETHSVPVTKVICGRTKERVAKVARAFGWEEYETSWRKVVGRSDIDLIDIATPNNTHKDIVIEAAKAGKHIICEKPLATNFADAKKMLEAVASAGIKHMVCFNYRKIPAISLIKKIIEEGRLGKIYHFRIVWLQDWLTDPGLPIEWRLRRELAGSGVLGDIGSHLIDLGRFLVDDFAKVIGMQETFNRKRPISRSVSEMQEVDVDEATLFFARFKNGALGSFECTGLAHGRRNGQRIEINGSKGSLVFNFEDMNILWYYSNEDPKELQGFRRIHVTEPIHPYIPDWWEHGQSMGFGDTFINLVYDFMKGVDEDRMPSPNFEDGLECQRVLEAVEKSAKEERWVEIAEVN